MKVYIVRHGQVPHNALKQYNTNDEDLTDLGIKQAEEVRDKIEKKNIDLIICSPLDRTKQTAEIINKNLKLPIKYNDKLKERNFGIYEGKTSKEVEKWEEILKYHQKLD